jgi:ribulose kinase
MTLASTRGDLVRAVLEGCAFALRDVQDDFAGLGHRPRALRLSGGGGRSGLWRQIVADVLAQPLIYHASDSTLGAAMVAAVGLGLHGDWRSATRSMVHAAAHHEPLADNVERYREGYRAFCKAREPCSRVAMQDNSQQGRSSASIPIDDIGARQLCETQEIRTACLALSVQWFGQCKYRVRNWCSFMGAVC